MPRPSRQGGLIPSFTPPDPTTVLEVPDPVINPDTNEVEIEWRKLANDNNWPATVEYLRGRQEYYRMFLPGGTEAAKLKTYEEKGKMWEVAATIVNEIDAWVDVVEGYKNAKKPATEPGQVPSTER